MAELLDVLGAGGESRQVVEMEPGVGGEDARSPGRVA